jgi:hypothetical protein
MIPLGGILVFIAATLGPETRDAVLLDQDTKEPESEPVPHRAPVERRVPTPVA